MPQPSLGWGSDAPFSLPEDCSKAPSFDSWSSVVEYGNISESGKGSQEADDESGDIGSDSLRPGSNAVTRLLGYMAVRVVARHRFFRAMPCMLGEWTRFGGLIDGKTSALDSKVPFCCDSLSVDQAEASEVGRVEFLAHSEKDELFEVELVVIDATTSSELALVEG